MRIFEAWPKAVVIRIFNKEKFLMGEIRKGTVDLFDEVCTWISPYGEEIYISVRIKKHDEIFWTVLHVDDVENLIIEDFKVDDVHVQPEIISGDGFPLSSEAMWKVFIAATATE